MRVAVFGGSFDPPHVGHVLGVCYALSVGRFERVLVVPVYEHALHKALSSFEHRVAMARAAVASLAGVEVSRVEEELPSPSYTLNTLSHLKTCHPDYELELIVGSDVLDETTKWHAFDAVCEAAPPFVLGRAGARHPGPEPHLPAVSSTEVRGLLRAGGDAAESRLRRLVPAAVLEYIQRHGLYR
jgi:nicotinate-nucleotide adenylyltransferase